jgi:hypothetical protein
VVGGGGDEVGSSAEQWVADEVKDRRTMPTHAMWKAKSSQIESPAKVSATWMGSRVHLHNIIISHHDEGRRRPTLH